MDIHSELARSVQDISAITDPLARIRAAHGLITQMDDATKTLSALRRADTNALTGPGGTMTVNELADVLGLTPRRVAQLRTSPPAPERNFFGSVTDPLIVVIPQKGDVTGAHVVSTGATRAMNGLHDLAADLGLEVADEILRPGDAVNFNRPNFVLVAGPRHNAMIEQIVAADPNFTFHRGERHWTLTDNTANVTYTSPRDHGEHGDICYVGRLPRPDQNGTFLYIGSLHAMGAAGVVHWLQHNLADLFRTVRNRRFSFLVQCAYDPVSEQVTSSERITPIYTPDK